MNAILVIKLFVAKLVSVLPFCAAIFYVEFRRTLADQNFAKVCIYFESPYATFGEN